MAEQITYADKPWIKSYKLGPTKLKETMEPYPRVPLYKILDDSADKYPSTSAINFLGRIITYRELRLNVDKLATALTDLGVKKDDKVAVMLPNCPQYAISEFGILKTGAVHVPCSIMLRADTLQHEMVESGAETIICWDQSLDLVNSIRDKTKLKNIIITSDKDYSLEEPEVKEIPGTYQLKDLIAKYEPNPPEVQIDPMEDLAILAFTGGATGIPKGVMITHFCRMANLMQGIPWASASVAAGIIGKTSVLIAVPLFHQYGEYAMESAIHWAQTVLLIADPRDTDSIIKYLKEFRPAHTCVVPTQLMRIAESKIGRMPVGITSAAAPLPKETAEAIKADTKMPVGEAYGLTEAGPATHMNLSIGLARTGFMREAKEGIGVPIVDTECKIVNPESGEDVPVGETGELYIRGPQVMKGYWPTPGNGLVDGWLPTGDIARMDEDGYFFLVDRVKDMANVSGYKVYTRVIDEVLFQHPAVAMAVAIGIPDPERPGSERIKAYIKLKQDYEGKVTGDEIIEWCRDKMEPYARPRSVEFRDDLPMTVTGKLFKRELREEEIKNMKERGELK